MSSRFGPSALHQRDPRSALFENYTGDRIRPGVNPASQNNNSNSNNNSATRGGERAGYGGYGYDMKEGGGGGGGGEAGRWGKERDRGEGEGERGGYRAATPNSRGQYSDAILSELENQNESELSGLSSKVSLLKNLSLAISSEITSSSTLADEMNDSFDTTRLRLRGTMNRMLRVARTMGVGVGWRAWVLFLGAVGVLGWWVWVF